MGLYFDKIALLLTNHAESRYFFMCVYYYSGNAVARCIYWTLKQ